MKTNHNNFLRLAFNLAQNNLGKTNLNPSVGCIVVKNNSVISSGVTSISGRPHAEFNALSNKKNFVKSDMYVTMEPCTHFGITPPCTDLIIKKKIKRVFYFFDDIDKRTAKKLRQKLTPKKVKVYQLFDKKFNKFYESYFSVKNDLIPLIDAKIAISKDFYTISKKSRWITNYQSRKRAHLLRSQYDAVLSTSRSINQDNSLLNCRIEGFDQNKPDLFIIDLKLKIKKNIKLFKNIKKRKIFIITHKDNSNRVSFFKNKNIKFIYIKSLKDKIDFIKLFKIMKRYNKSRILVETGLIFLNNLLKKKLIKNLYLFQSSYKLGNKGLNNASNNILKKIRINNQIKVNLNGDKIYKVKI
tara:strand:+ start:29 stop:1096 length:1068 start_codon:yes stop_codon:yes gene_type:complete